MSLKLPSLEESTEELLERITHQLTRNSPTLKRRYLFGTSRSRQQQLHGQSRAWCNLAGTASIWRFTKGTRRGTSTSPADRESGYKLLLHHQQHKLLHGQPTHGEASVHLSVEPLRALVPPMCHLRKILRHRRPLRRARLSQ
jgi:hypothetical protein